jgi:hypothetical protein
VKIDISNALYTVAMILLAFVAALVVTKTIAKYVNKDEEDEL